MVGRTELLNVENYFSVCEYCARRAVALLKIVNCRWLLLSLRPLRSPWKTQAIQSRFYFFQFSLLRICALYLDWAELYFTTLYLRWEHCCTNTLINAFFQFVTDFSFQCNSQITPRGHLHHFPPRFSFCWLANNAWLLPPGCSAVCVYVYVVLR